MFATACHLEIRKFGPKHKKSSKFFPSKKRDLCKGLGDSLSTRDLEPSEIIPREKTKRAKIKVANVNEKRFFSSH
jgi:hypothetical protein